MNESEHEPVSATDLEQPASRGQRMSRRFFLKSSGAAVASTGAVAISTMAVLDGRSSVPVADMPLWSGAAAGVASCAVAERPSSTATVPTAAAPVEATAAPELFRKKRRERRRF